MKKENNTYSGMFVCMGMLYVTCLLVSNLGAGKMWAPFGSVIVPAAVMLRGFTANGTALLAGVNIGGLGTPIASMASLISLQFYRKADGAQGQHQRQRQRKNTDGLHVIISFHYC